MVREMVEELTGEPTGELAEKLAEKLAQKLAQKLDQKLLEEGVLGNVHSENYRSWQWSMVSSVTWQEQDQSLFVSPFFFFRRARV